MRDNPYIDPPRTPEEGYHLTEDLADQALRMLPTSTRPPPVSPSSSTSPPAPSTHRTRPAPWIEPYRGRLRRRLGRVPPAGVRPPARQGVVPAGTILPDRPVWVAPWAELSADERRWPPASGGLRRVPQPHRRPDRPGPGGLDDSAWPTTPSSALLGQRRQRRGRPRRPAQRAPLPRPDGREDPASSWPASTRSAASGPTTTIRGAGPGPATRPSSCGSATPGWAGCARP